VKTKSSKDKNMKTKILASLMMAAAAVVVSAPQAHANLLPAISGSISFSGVATVNNGPNLANASKFTGINAVVTSDSGDYGIVPVFPTTVYLSSPTGTPNHPADLFYPPGTPTGGTVASPGLMNLYTFHPPSPPVIPLWSFDYLGINYAFDATTMISAYNAVSQEWDISGRGIAFITGDAPTPGTWNADVGKEGTSFFFGSAATVPDGGLTVILLGGALMALTLIRRRVAS
jgi:hypothetical protein